MKLLNDYTLEELRAIENFGEQEEFNAFAIVPMEELHDSGYRCMKFILERDNDIVGAVSGWSDVVHVNGIGGYGEDFKQTMVSGMVPVVGMSMDCLPKSGCVRFFCDRSKIMKAETFIGSDFIFYFKVRKGDLDADL